MKIALLGYGKMGKTIEKLAVQKGHSILVKSTSKSDTIDLSKVDIAIEFSSPVAAINNITQCLENNIPIVSGTTGWLDRFDEILKLCEKRTEVLSMRQTLASELICFLKLMNMCQN